jgi:hypothetical protein
MFNTNVLNIYGKDKEKILSSLSKLEMEEKGYILMNSDQPTPYHSANYDGNWVIHFSDNKELLKFYVDNDNKKVKNMLSKKLTNNETYEAKYREASSYLINPSENEYIYPTIYKEAKIRNIDMYTLANMIIAKYNENKNPFLELENIRIEYKVALENSTDNSTLEQKFRLYEQRIKAFIESNLSPTR